MKNFIIRGTVFFLLAFFGFGLIAHLRVSPMFIKFKNEQKGGWIKVHERINRSKQKANFKRVYIGDSVGNQLFDFDSTPNSFCSNAAVSLIGNYILIENLLASNSQIEEIILVSVPNDIGWNFEQKLTFNNFVKPFLSFSNLNYIDDIVYDKLWEKPFSWLYIFYAVKILPISDINFSDETETSVSYLEEIKLTTLSDIAVHYLKKLDALCKEKNIFLKIVSPPVPEHWSHDTNNWANMKTQIDSLGLNSVFLNYFDEINYYPDNYFSDGLHLSEQYISHAREELLQKLD
ncbi:MAG: hypothetical protein U9R19_02875 [Bacteroidota bacterium]|nr:hypothetical protein [Bacteroidota bacterium]